MQCSDYNSLGIVITAFVIVNDYNSVIVMDVLIDGDYNSYRILMHILTQLDYNS